MSRVIICREYHEAVAQALGGSAAKLPSTKPQVGAAVHKRAPGNAPRAALSLHLSRTSRSFCSFAAIEVVALALTFAALDLATGATATTRVECSGPTVALHGESAQPGGHARRSKRGAHRCHKHCFPLAKSSLANDPTDDGTSSDPEDDDDASDDLAYDYEDTPGQNQILANPVCLCSADGPSIALQSDTYPQRFLMLVRLRC
jgi:hypothetical protein